MALDRVEFRSMLHSILIVLIGEKLLYDEGCNYLVGLFENYQKYFKFSLMFGLQQIFNDFCGMVSVG